MIVLSNSQSTAACQRHARQAHALGDGRIGFTGAAGQDDLGTHNRLR